MNFGDAAREEIPEIAAFVDSVWRIILTPFFASTMRWSPLG
jgi:hypothetical protein